MSLEEGRSTQIPTVAEYFPHQDCLEDTERTIWRRIYSQPQSLFLWDGVQEIKSALQFSITDELGGGDVIGRVESGAYIKEEDGKVHVCQGAVIESGAMVCGPAYIGENCTVRHGAYVRENCAMFHSSIVGHASEVKNSIICEYAAAPHFNYVGDSVLGAHTNLGAGTKIGNLEMVSGRKTISILIDGIRVDTGMRKLGAIMGDGSQTGCNTVLNPGCLIGPKTFVFDSINLPKGLYRANVSVRMKNEVIVEQKQ
eukprot:GHVN01019204.1.p1 GENE.GHVN01019204.1~~GHVN01019204.1.p1  ORF type:complete len:255 (+),score=24.35 GHVN01019204.1:114-878(+)